LADHLKKGVRFTEAQLLDVLRQVAQGLSHIHKKGLAHLDVKPENIYVDLQVGFFSIISRCVAVHQER
jgi:serine/threonine protein kinase